MYSPTSIIFDARFLDKNGKSGISRDSKAFLRQLIENEWSVDLLKFRSAKKESDNFEELPFTRIAKSLTRTTAESIVFGKHLDVPNLEANFFFLSQVSPIRVNTKNYTCKRIIRIHDLFPATNPDWFTPKARLHFKAGLNSINKDDLLITNSNATTEALFRLLKGRISFEQVREIPCPETDFKCSVACKTCELCSESYSVSRYFLAVGTIEPRKNYLNLLAGWEKSKAPALGYKLVLVGNLGWKNREILKKISSSAGVLHLRGICDYQLYFLYKNAFAFVSASINEGFNIPLHEAQKVGAKLILSDIEIHREIATKDSATWFNPFGSNSIKEAIDETIQNPSRAIKKVPVNLFANQVKKLLDELSKRSF